jgi:gliding motility-associated-like protein
LSITGADKYMWSNGATGNVVNITQPGKVWVKATNSATCSASDTINVTLGGVTIKIDTSICEGESIKIKNEIFDKNNLKNTIVVPNPNGCDSIFEVNVKVRLKIKVSLLGSTSICPGQETDIIVDASGYTGTFDLLYNINGVLQPILKGVKNGDKIKVKPNSTSQYEIFGLFFPQPACNPILGAFAKIEVGGLKPKAKATSNFNGFNVPCIGYKGGEAEVSITGGKAPFKYSWSDGSNNDILKNVGAGKYKVTVTDDTGCSGVDSVNIIEPKDVTANFKTIAPLCKNPKSGMIVIDSLKGGTGIYTYELNNYPLGQTPSNSFKINGLEGGKYLISVKDQNGCSFRSTLSIPKTADLQLYLGPDVTLDYGDSIDLNAKTNFIIDKIKWNTKQFLSCNDCPNPTSKPLKTITYAAIATDSSGCSVTDSIKIAVNKAFNVFIPNGFSPNGDNNNDVFMIFGNAKFVVNIKSFRVFDRWGNTVFSDFNFKPNDPTHGWDGSFKGQRMNSAVFAYGVEVEFLGGTTEVFKGDVTLIYE